MAGIFPKLLGILDCDVELKSNDRVKLFAFVLEAITACLSSCSSSKSTFEAFIGYNGLVKLVLTKVPPCEEVNSLLLLLLFVYCLRLGVRNLTPDGDRTILS